MTDATVHAEDTVSLEATLPRDLTNDDVELLIGSDESTVVTAVVDDAESGRVTVPLNNVDLETGVTEIKFRVTDSNDLKEHIPPEGDVLEVYE